MGNERMKKEKNVSCEEWLVLSDITKTQHNKDEKRNKNYFNVSKSI